MLPTPVIPSEARNLGDRNTGPRSLRSARKLTEFTPSEAEGVGMTEVDSDFSDGGRHRQPEGLGWVSQGVVAGLGEAGDQQSGRIEARCAVRAIHWQPLGVCRQDE